MINAQPRSKLTPKLEVQEHKRQEKRDLAFFKTAKAQFLRLCSCLGNHISKQKHIQGVPWSCLCLGSLAINTQENKKIRIRSLGCVVHGSLPADLKVYGNWTQSALPFLSLCCAASLDHPANPICEQVHHTHSAQESHLCYQLVFSSKLISDFLGSKALICVYGTKLIPQN